MFFVPVHAENCVSHTTDDLPAALLYLQSMSSDDVQIYLYSPADALHFLHLINTTHGGNRTLEAFERDEALLNTAEVNRRLLLEQQGTLIGFAELHSHYMPPGVLSAGVFLLSDLRGHGLGTQLWQRLVKDAESFAPVILEAAVSDRKPQSRAWAEKQGFQLVAHRIFSLLDLETTQLQEPQLPQGFALVSMQEVLDQASDEQHAWDRFHDLLATLSSQIPDEGGRIYTPEEVSRWAQHNPVFDRDTSLLLVHEGHWVGMILNHAEHPDERHIGMTGVLPEFQGKGLAKALKQASAVRARSLGISRFLTENDARNAPMRAINEKLGYHPRAGTWRLQQHLK